MAVAEAGSRSEVDPTTLSVVWNKLDHVLAEMGEKILHATQSFVMALVRDMGQCLLNPQGEIVAVASYLPIHMFPAEVAIRSFLEKFEGDFHPGDFFIGNDPYIVRSGHLPDWTMIRPVFYGDELVGFFQFRGHMADTGGFLPGGYAPGAYDVIAEGLNIPPIRIVSQGVVEEELWGLVKRNVRNPDLVEMDVMLVNGAMAQGEAELSRLIDKYGLDDVRACMAEMLARGESAMRRALAEIPDGVYEGESATDWDGHTDQPIYVRSKLILEGDELTIDLTESDPQATFVNTPEGTTFTSAVEAVYSMLDPHIPKNHGSMKPIRIVTKPGTVVDPTYPATVGASAIAVGCEICEAVQLAMGEALPERAMGMFARHFCPIAVGYRPDRIDPRTGTIEHYFAETFASDGSGGAVKGFDGWQGVGTYGFVGCIVRPDIEMFETQVPYWVPRYELLADWEGAGEFRGGPGIYLETAANDDMSPDAPAILMSGNCDGSRFPPKGVAAGWDAPLNEMWIESPAGETRVFRTMTNMPMKPGEVCKTRAGGGGGWGDPLNRASERVEADVVEGIVSLERAREVYGVVIEPETLEVRRDETERLRAELRAKASSG